MSINKAIVAGNLGRDPEIRALPSGQSVASFSIATTARFKDRHGEPQERTEWPRTEPAFVTRTEIVAQQLRLLGSRINGTVAPQTASDDTPF